MSRSEADGVVCALGGEQSGVRGGGLSCLTECGSGTVSSRDTPERRAQKARGPLQPGRNELPVGANVVDRARQQREELSGL
ncbi:MAG: hypothetical protein JO342_17140 [Solirubrobacterales bacterium]|nr:hypothetical protein [Solirubrobacterales bacterium]MBV9167865.1 hypothetical protein [Solirubrobacterales bacterium]